MGSARGAQRAARISEVRLREVRKVFAGRHPALRGVSCCFHGGQPTLLMGPNGAGKSTLLAILATLSRPTSGEVRYGELDPRQAEAGIRGRVGLVGHASMLYLRLSPRENLLFFARLHGVADPAAAAAGWLERMELTAGADRPLRQLSRGMVQRVSLARALIHEPDLLLLDEPFTGLDQQAGDLLRRELSAAGEAGRIVVLVSHDVTAVDGLCGELVVLRQGRVVAEVSEPRMPAARILEHYHASA